MKFYGDLGVDPQSDNITLYISYLMNAATMGEYSFDEFKQGLSKLGVSSVDELKRKLPNLYADMRDPAKFKDFYKYLFDYSRDSGFKNVPVDTAIGLWEMLLSDKCKFLRDFIEFLQTEKKDLNVISKDTWMMLLELIEQTRGDFANFVDDGAWPSMIDQFNEFYSSKHKK